MDEKSFSSIVTVSSNIAERSMVKRLRPLSRGIIKEIQEYSGISVISGIRGSGKTTLLSEIYKNEKDAIFINSEIVLKHGVSLLELLHYAYAKRYKTFLIDEIHVLPEWEKDIKIFYDETRSKIIASGSSAIYLKAKGSELSRRARFHEIKPLSFREYIYFVSNKLLPKLNIESIIKGKVKEFERMLMPYITYYSSYVNFDALPAAFFERNPEVYINILERTIRYDLAYLREIDNYYIDAVYKIIKSVAISKPAELSYSGLSKNLGISIKLVKEIISSLERSGILYKIGPYAKGRKSVRKEDKILMPLSLRSALCSYYGILPEKGSIREDFFVQHVGDCFYLKTGKIRRTPDFVVGNYIFEVGGKSKSSRQILDLENAYLVKEGVNLSGKERSIYLFGLTY
ncbi:MAG: hypothetical protein DRP03_01365 [Candidatus Aenigmatarchaeota archaeon]|nr:MAG: hypothetical protein DRP03_01365 [Candidatus Aenigmarchaeota archaeon]